MRGNLFDGVSAKINKRTRIIPELENNDISRLKEFSYEEIAIKVSEIKDNTLIIVNTKKDAVNIYREIEKICDAEAFYLSTNMCAQHRLDKIENIKKSLKNSNKRTVCVSTQLIEAGVDISFECVVRALAGLDSIIQAAGRCNRNDDSHTEKEVYVIRVKGSDLSKLPEIKQAGEITEALLSDKECRNDLLSDYSINKYYGQFLERNKNDFDYNIPNTNLFDLHSMNNKGINAYSSVNGKNGLPFLRCAYRTIGEEFCLIEKGGIAVYVPYDDEAKRLIRQFNNGERTSELFIKLGKYSVNLYQYQIDELNYSITLKNDLYFINESCYNKDIGIVTDSDALLLI
jgi:CRISPR-associated endonuclease/helicase Cas3